MNPRHLVVPAAVMSLLVGLPATRREALAQEPSPPGAPGGAGGAISEEEFKKLHELRQDAPPALHGQMVAVGGDQLYLSMPVRDGKSAAAPLPAVIVIHEWWGLNANVKHWTDRLAAEGYAALAVDLYEGHVETTADGALARMKAVDEAAAARRLKAALDFVKGDPRIRATKVASIGWCFGGHWSLRLALEAPLDATVIYYGRLITDADRLKAIKGPVCGVFGTRDPSIPQEQVDAFDRALTQASVAHEVHRFDADHAFGNPSNPHYDSASATEAWARVRTFLARHLRP